MSNNNIPADTIIPLILIKNNPTIERDNMNLFCFNTEFNAVRKKKTKGTSGLTSVNCDNNVASAKIKANAKK